VPLLLLANLFVRIARLTLTEILTILFEFRAGYPELLSANNMLATQ